ncbi:MAG: hypothetical protein Q4B81_05760 [Moraxella sp.]|nr:hypothetical protein [Moraxella sp.]
MSQIQSLVDTLNHYKTLPHHSDDELSKVFFAVQAWQKQRIHNANQALFDNPKTAPLTHYLIDRIYGDKDFDVLATQLLTAGNNALNGSGRLEKLIPQNTLATGILGVKAAVLAIELDLAIAQFIRQDDALYQSFLTHGIDDTLMVQAYQGVNHKEQRIAQIKDIKEVCELSYSQFNSFLLQKAFALAKSTAYHHGYQPLYDFIHDGLHAIKAIKKIDDFTKPFTHTELATIERIHHDGRVYE